ncbi:uncharacterized protein LOC135528646 [Oncorhynchus masou masou]|uniref:uncharacterized protein LOC135528646 n=1 Tax=Oncorhynchus masou masou TaxID=90313 RepID=UPI0031839683
MPSLSSVVQFSLLLVLLLAVMGQDCATSQVQSEARSRVCVKDKVSDCVDLTKMQELIQEVQKDFTNTSHDGRILLKTVIFDKIKKHKKYHGCVLLKIMDFYREVLQRQDRNYLDLRGLLDELKECVQTGKICEKLYQEAAGEPVNESKIEEDLELLSKDAAILQLQRLEGARKKVVELSDKGKGFTDALQPFAATLLVQCDLRTQPMCNFESLAVFETADLRSRVAEIISAYAALQSLNLLDLTETWITPENTAAPAALPSCGYVFSRSPRASGRRGALGELLNELNTLIS